MTATPREMAEMFFGCRGDDHSPGCVDYSLEGARVRGCVRLTALIAEAVAGERERCAKIALKRKALWQGVERDSMDREPEEANRANARWLEAQAIEASISDRCEPPASALRSPGAPR